MKVRNKILFFLCFLCVICLTCASVSAENIAEPEYIDFPEEVENPGAPQIYVVLKSINGQYWKTMQAGMAQAGEERDCGLYIGGILDEANIDGQKELVQKAINRKADALILAPAHSSALAEDCAAARKAGIPVIIVDTSISTDDYDVSLMTDNMRAGEEAAAEMLRRFQENGISEEQSVQVGIQLGSASSQTLINRVAGFVSYWTLHAGKNWTIIDEIKVNNGNVDTAVSICEEFLDRQKYPELKGLFGCNNGSTVGFVRGMEAKGRKDIVLIGFDYSDEMAAMIAAGEYPVSTIVQQQKQMGYQGVLHALEILSGKKQELKYIDTGVHLVTHENVNTPEIQALLN